MLYSAFQAYDRDGSGTLTADELMGILLNPNTGTPMTLDDAQEFVKYADTNGDGVLDYYELCAALGQPPVAESLPMGIAMPAIPIAQVSAIQIGEQPKLKVPKFKGDENSLAGKVERVRTTLGIEEGTIIAVVNTAVDMLGIADKLPTNAKLVEKADLCFAELFEEGGSPQQPISFLPVTEYDEVWNDKGSRARQDVSVWKARVPPGCYSLGMTAKNGHSKPTFPTLVVRASGNQIAPPDRYELAWWQERGQRRFWCWHPIAPPGYTALGDVGTLSDQPPSREEMLCVAIASLPGAKQPLGTQIWNDRGGGAPKDAAFWAMPGGTGLFRCNDDATHNKPPGDFYLPQAPSAPPAAPTPMVMGMDGEPLGITYIVNRWKAQDAERRAGRMFGFGGKSAKLEGPWAQQGGDKAPWELCAYGGVEAARPPLCQPPTPRY